MGNRTLLYVAFPIQHVCFALARKVKAAFHSLKQRETALDRHMFKIDVPQEAL